MNFDGALFYRDTYHLNDADRLPNGNTLISLLLMNLVVEVNQEGEIVWYAGDLDDISNSIIFRQHNPTRLMNNNTIICDSVKEKQVVPTSAKKSRIGSLISDPAYIL